MPQSLSNEYLEHLCAAREYEGLCHISAVLCGSTRFDPAQHDYGFPTQIFCLIERLTWFAQGFRSGAWTYFEATHPERQQALLKAISLDTANPEFASQYAIAMEAWRDPSAMRVHDTWLDSHDAANNAIMWQIVCENRDLLIDLTSQ